MSNCSSRNRPHIGVIGGSECATEVAQLAERVGAGIAERGGVLVCGGLAGVMEAACRGAKQAGGTTIGILPGHERAAANEHVDIAIATGLGEARNLSIIRTADRLIAIDGSHGTLSEIGFALRVGKRVVGLQTWDIAGVIRAESPEQALDLAFEGLGQSPG
ncbi:MAG: TIGR00725 family protein [candidate division WOR-3 bacterium]|nr:MAG: TIGR00725 family protein [candidate division WOR-3 bacterium]